MKRTPVIFLVFGVVVLAAFLALASHSSAAPADPPAVSVNGPQSPNACGTGDVGGTVFREVPVNGSSLNTYGVKDSNELGVKDVTVTVIDANGAILTPVTTDSTGAWAVTSPTFPVRVEFTVPDELAESFNGTDSPTSVQFVSASDCNVDFGVHYPGDYSSVANPDIASSRQLNGQTASNTDPAHYTFSYDTGGTPANKGAGLYGPYDNVPNWGTAANVTATFEDIGSTWGEAYQKEKKRLFLAAMLRRHSGLAHGLDAIYVFDYTSSPPTLSHFNLQGVSGVDLGSVTRNNNCNADGTIQDDYSLCNAKKPNRDLDVYAKVGKVGYGDIDMSEDGNYLWAVNLKQRSLIKIDVSGDTLPGTVTEYDPTYPSCPGGVLRPWALKFYMGKGYLGAVCDASTSNNDDDIAAYVFSFDPADPTTLTTELTFNLHYERSTQSTHDYHLFRRWRDDWPGSERTYYRKEYPVPVLSDIEFGADGSMFLGILGRWTFQGGVENYDRPVAGNKILDSAFNVGEILKVCSVDGAWVLEGANGCPANFNTSDGTGVAGGGEFFFDAGGDLNKEASEGALAILQGSGHLVSSFNDPHYGRTSPTPVESEYYDNDGLEWLNLSDGKIHQFIQFSPTKDNSNDDDTARAAGFGKAASMGDVELLTDPAPLEIGNRLWCDTGAGDHARNGVQDPDEISPAINGASVILQCDIDGDGFGGPDDVTATTTTDANGNYYFKDGDASLSSFPTATWDSSLHIIPRNTSCRVLVDYTQSAIPDACGADSAPTSQDSGEGANADLNDSDGDSSVGSSSQVGTVFTTGSSGENNHSYDFGFASPKVAIGNFVWHDANGNSQADSGEDGIDGVQLKLYRDSDGDGVFDPGSDTEVATATTSNGGFYQFLNVDPSTPGAANTYYFVAVVKSSVPSDYKYSSDGGAQDPDATGDQDAANGDDGIPVGDYVVSQPFPATLNGQTNTGDSGDPAGYDDDSAYMTVDFGFLTQDDYGNMTSPNAIRLGGMSARSDAGLWVLGLLVVVLVGVTAFFWQRRRAF